MDLQSRYVDELYPGSMDDEQARAADAKLYVDFSYHHIPDFIATEGGTIQGRMENGKPVAEDDNVQARVDELLAVGCRFKQHRKEADLLVVLPCGRPVYRDREFITIMKPGDRDNIVMRPVEPEDRLRFEKRYNDWKKGEEEGSSGTPLEELAFISSAEREEFRFFNVRTAEQLAAMSDGVAQKFPRGNSLRTRAQRYLEAAEKKAPFDELHQEIKQRDDKMSEMAQTIEALKEKLAGLEVKSSKRG